MFYFKIARLDTMKGRLFTGKRPAVQAGLFSLRQTVQWGIRIGARYRRPVFPSVSGVKGSGRNGGKTFQRVASSEKEADVFPPTKAWLLSLESRKTRTV